MKIRIKRIDKELPLPEFHTAGSVGFDMYSRIDIEVRPKELVYVPSNLIIETPKDYMLMMAARSGTFRKKGLILPNAVGIFDQDFCGEGDEMIIQIYNLSEETVNISRGERIAQGIFIPVEIAEWQEVEVMESKNRGGLGSTGN
jgi:dUTP pyrophosphatase